MDWRKREFLALNANERIEEENQQQQMLTDDPLAAKIQQQGVADHVKERERAKRRRSE